MEDRDTVALVVVGVLGVAALIFFLLAWKESKKE